MKRIYLDYNATTPIDPDIAEALKNLDFPLNPSSVHFYGKKSKGYYLDAVDSIAKVLRVKPTELFFTSSATEALNWIFYSFSQKFPQSHVITSNVEHVAIDAPLKHLEKEGRLSVSYLPVGLKGSLDVEQIAAAITEKTKMVVLMSVNNETGVKTDIASIAQLTQQKGIFLVVDAVAHFGKDPFTLFPGISAAIFSGHKIHAPLGSGLLFSSSSSFPLTPLFLGGGQERGLRSGTENVPAIVGLSMAFKKVEAQIDQIAAHMQKLKNQLIKGLQQLVPHAFIHGQAPWVSNTFSMAFPGYAGEDLWMHLDLAGVCTSLGSACSSGTLAPSRVLLQMDIDPLLVRSSLRFSLGRITTEQEIADCLERCRTIFCS